jgi:hypothetical protein
MRTNGTTHKKPKGRIKWSGGAEMASQREISDESKGTNGSSHPHLLKEMSGRTLNPVVNLRLY